MKIVFFTNKSSHGLEILEELNANGIIIDSIFIERRTKKKKTVLKNIHNKFLVKLLLLLPQFIYDLLLPFYWKWTNKNLPNESFYSKYSKNIFTVDNFNSELTEKHLKIISPDLLILGGSRIIKSHILDIPKIGTLNAHPGILPEYRGVDVIAWSVLNNDPIGATVHFVNRGVDLGEICRKDKIVLHEDESLDSIKIKVEKLCANLMSKVVSEIKTKNEIKTFPNDKSKGKQYYKMDGKTKARVESMIRKMRNE